MIKLSIIIPIYNREKTIKRALDSIINQIDENIELMLINDGSTDDTDKVINDYILETDKKITYYTKQNEGIATTRNFGIKKAKGNYIIFVDSDDYVDENLIKELEKYMEQGLDMIKFKAQIVDEKTGEINKIDGPTFDTTTGKKAFNILAFTDNLIDSPCIYAFKKELFTKNDYYFTTGTYHEDFGLIPLILASAKQVVSLDFYGYNYVQTDNSITRNNDYTKTIKRFKDTLLHYDNMLKFISKIELDEETTNNIKIYYTNAVLLKLKEIKKQDRKEYIKEIKIRKMIKNIKIYNIRQLIKRLILSININWYLDN